MHAFPPYFPKIHTNIILPSTPRSSEWFFPTKILYALLISYACNIPWPSYPSWLDHTNYTGEAYDLWSSSLRSLLLFSVSLPYLIAPKLTYLKANQDMQYFIMKYIRGCIKVSWLAAWSENCKWYSSLPLGAVVSLFCESVLWVLPP
jgi:hypothetical protein